MMFSHCLFISASDALEPDPTCETPQRPKLAVQRQEQILSPISNGLTPVRVRLVRLSPSVLYFCFLDAQTTSIG